MGEVYQSPHVPRRLSAAEYEKMWRDCRILVIVKYRLGFGTGREQQQMPWAYIMKGTEENDIYAAEWASVESMSEDEIRAECKAIEDIERQRLLRTAQMRAGVDKAVRYG